MVPEIFSLLFMENYLRDETYKHRQNRFNDKSIDLPWFTVGRATSSSVSGQGTGYWWSGNPVALPYAN